MRPTLDDCGSLTPYEITNKLEVAAREAATRRTVAERSSGGRGAQASAGADVGAAPLPAMAVLPPSESSSVERMLADSDFCKAIWKAEGVLADPDEFDHVALRIVTGGATQGNPQNRPYALLAQIAWGHVAASALAITAKLNVLHGLHSNMLGHICGTSVDKKHKLLKMGRLAKQFAAGDWGGVAAKASERSIIDFVAARNYARRTHAGDDTLYTDPEEDSLYMEIEHIVSTREMASECFQAYGFNPEHKHSWKNVVDDIQTDFMRWCPDEKATSDAATARRRALGMRLRRLVLDLFAEAAVRYTDRARMREPERDTRRRG